MNFILKILQKMKKVTNHFYKKTVNAGKHFNKHKHKYLFGLFGTFAIVKTFFLLIGFF